MGIALRTYICDFFFFFLKRQQRPGDDKKVPFVNLAF